MEIQLTSFLNKILHFFVHFIGVMFMFMIAVELALFYMMSQNIVCYWASTGVFGIALLLTFQMIREFEHFQDIYDQNISNSKLKTELNKPLNMEVEDLPLKACLLYRNGHSFQYVSKALGLSHADLGRRLVIKGLDILLKEYKKREVKTE